MDREERVRKTTNRFTFHEKGGTNPPTPPPPEPKKKLKWHKEEIKDDGSSDSYITGGFLPIHRPTAVVAPPPSGMGAVGGSGVVRARVAALNAATGAVGGAATGAVASRTFPLLVRTTTVEVGTQTDHMVFPFVFPGGGWTL